MSTQALCTLLVPAVAADKPDGDREVNSLDEDVVFDLLGNERRRACLKALLDAEDEQPLNDLSEQVTAEIDDSSTSADELYESVYISLCQSHLPKLEKVDLVEFDSDQKTVEPRPELDEIERHLQRETEADDEPEASLRYPFVAAGVTALGIATAVLGPPVVGSLVLPLLLLLNVGVVAGGAARSDALVSS